MIVSVVNIDISTEYSRNKTLHFFGLQARSLGLVAAVIADAGRTQIAAGSRTVTY